MFKYGVCPLDRDLPCFDTNDAYEAVSVFAAIAMQGKAVALQRLHVGDDKPSGYYDTIDTANI